MMSKNAPRLETFQLATVVATGRGIFAGPFASQIPFKNKQSFTKSVRFAKSMGIEIIYVDVFRDGVLVSASSLRTIKEDFEKMGFKVIGEAALGMGTGDKFAKQAESRDKTIGPWEMAAFDCWSHSRTKDGYRKIVHRAAGVFDSFLLDDCFGTNCFCPLCLKCFQDKSGYKINRDEFLWLFNRVSDLTGKSQKIFLDWIKYQMDRWAVFAQENIVQVMKDVNPDIKIFAKLPQWDEFYNFCGYSLEKIFEIFDKVYVGTEIRDHLTDYPYYGYLHAQLIKDYCGYKDGGYTWFDTYSFTGSSLTSPISTEALIAQARQSMLGGCREMIIVPLGDLLHSSRRQAVGALKKELPVLKVMGSYTRTLPALGAKLLHLEPNFAGLTSVIDNMWSMDCLPGRDLYFGSVIGMLGIPLVCEARKEDLNKNDVVLITEMVTGKGEFLDWDIEKFINSGGVGIFTAKAVESIFRIQANDHLVRLFTGERHDFPRIPPYTDAIEGFIIAGKKVRCRYPLSAGPLILPPKNARVHLYGISNNKKIPLIFESPFGQGRIIALNVTFPHKQFLFGYPQGVINLIRNIFFEGLGVKIEAKERNICLHLYKGALAIENHNSFPIELTIVFDHKIRHLKDVVTGKEILATKRLKQSLIHQKLMGKELKFYEKVCR